jgi:hypothetical protein
VLLHTFLNSELDVWSALHAGHFNPRGTVPRDSLSFRLGGSHSRFGHFGEGKNILYCRESNSYSPIIQHIAYSIHRRCYPGTSNQFLTLFFPNVLFYISCFKIHQCTSQKYADIPPNDPFVSLCRRATPCITSVCNRNPQTQQVA